MTPVLSVAICTWNRAALLDGALEALAQQHGAPAHEILVVDNASHDHTAAVVQRWASRHPRITYILEPQPGLACARNAATRRARAPLIAFTDDDVRVEPDWVARIVDAFEWWADASCVGGPVIPAWPSLVPDWLTARQWAPLGVQDYGAEPLRADASNPICLIGANLAFRRSALEAIGEFNPAVQRVGNGAGSTEDHELHLRLWRAGRYGMYDPSIRVTAVVSPDRLRKAYHRTWHFGHGRHIARMWIPEMERTRTRILGVPGHVLRQAASDALRCAVSLASGDVKNAFEREARLWFAAGFVRERVGGVA
jgi:glycosyltransferase involved in cell wall biosynthesis